MSKRECVAMILAGGQGSRLGCLTKNLAKPAVPFGGKYRIIDFTLSNCSNSDIDTVGVLTQYEPLILNSYIGTGSPWNLDRNIGGVTVLPPYMNVAGGEWYKGTANAIYQNISFINQYNPDYVLVLSGDHIYKMDYSLMLEYHKQREADATIAVIEVPMEEASRFGIMNTGDRGRIVEFEEKPRQPKNNLASMGIYIFNWSELKQFLIEDEKDNESKHDFGKNIIPKMLGSGLKLLAYPFKGYWRDVGTIESFWDANMDLLCDEPELDLYDSRWKIYSQNSKQPPSYNGNEAQIQCSLVNEGCMVFGSLDRVIMFSGVHVGEGAEIRDSIIMPDVKIGKNVVIERAIIGEGTVIGDGKRISGIDGDKECFGFEVTSTSIIVIPENSVLY